jgi:hypothetical protein
MASVADEGHAGCGFEHQLESVRAALGGSVRENAGFLRRGALLVVVFVSNEDDCSAPPRSDVFDKSRAAQYGYLSSYRCNRFGHVCAKGAPPFGDSGGPLAGCRSAQDGLLYGAQRYIDFFTRPGGLKPNPNDILLVGIVPPAEPYQVILSNPGTPGGHPYIPCGQLNEQANPPCVPVIQHSCQNNAQPVFFGDPAVRLHQVISAAANHRVSSICDADYSGAMQDLGRLIVTQIGLGCIPAPLPDPSAPECTVAEVTIRDDGSQAVRVLSHCASSAPPCWRIEEKPGCAAASPQGIGVTIDRGGAAPPDDTSARVTCFTTR